MRSRIAANNSRGTEFTAKEAWSTRKLQVYHGNAVQIDNHVYMSSGLGAPQFIAALNVTTGKVAWRKRGFGRATIVHADNKLFILDAAGNLGVATATPNDFVVHSKIKVLQEFSWTVPTIVGNTMYLRDQERIMALEIG